MAVIWLIACRCVSGVDICHCCQHCGLVFTVVLFVQVCDLCMIFDLVSEYWKGCFYACAIYTFKIQLKICIVSHSQLFCVQARVHTPLSKDKSWAPLRLMVLLAVSWARFRINCHRVKCGYSWDRGATNLRCIWPLASLFSTQSRTVTVSPLTPNRH